MLKLQLKFIVTILLVLGLSISFQSLLAQWESPTTSPPANNIARPINAGSSYQKKLGSFDVGGGLGVGANLTVLNNFTSGGTIFTDNISASTTGLNIDSGIFGMEFNIDSDGSGGDNFVYRVNGITMMTVSPNGDLLVNNNIYSSGSVLATVSNLTSNYYSKTEVDTELASYYTKSEIDTKNYTKAEVDAIISSLSIAAGSTLDLHNSLHSSSQCTDNSGVVITIGTDDYCRFSGECLGGWLSGYTTTISQTCNDSNCSGSTSCTTGSHTIQNISTEACSYGTHYNTYVLADCGDKTPGTCGYETICHSTITTCTATKSYSYCY